MSDAMTNREIEDVLTSIRRLVAQEGGRPADAGKLILTAEQRISPDLAQELAATLSGSASVADAHDTAGEITGAKITGDNDSTDAASNGEAGADDANAAQLGLPEPDFGKLEATIAELEAAVGGGEAPAKQAKADSKDAAAAQPEPALSPANSASNVTELYGRLSFRHQDPDASKDDVAAGAADQDDAAEREVSAAQTSESPTEFASMAEELADAQIVHDPNDLPIGGSEGLAQTSTSGAKAASEEPVMDATVLDADDIDGDAEETLIDEETLQALVAQMVRAELHGQLGERITKQVRKLVRAEIAKALDERKYL